MVHVISEGNLSEGEVKQFTSQASELSNCS